MKLMIMKKEKKNTTYGVHLEGPVLGKFVKETSDEVHIDHVVFL